ncbi:MAG: bifunctional methylenetetrahydrofolate dehydrogenase/methenyltetrahydrofolate cyclohydrolase, partial [Actinobacteria bacterium]|nr:bifunctional methylenetetrahydrofolate dehydrogenase/methenyltetrahydrofolate cyclohydrolase [Actinomycetota bacterium]
MTRDERTPTTGAPIVLDGNALRDLVVARVRDQVAKLSSAPCLATVLIGDDGPSQVYVRNKHKQAQLAGMTSRNEVLPANVSQRDAESRIRELAGDASVTGILVQQPVPSHLDGEALLSLIP